MSRPNGRTLAPLLVAILASSGASGCSKKKAAPAPADKPKEAASPAPQAKVEPPPAKKDSCTGPNDWKSPDGALCVTIPDGYKPDNDAPKKDDDAEYGDPTWSFSFEDEGLDSIGLDWGTKPAHWDAVVKDLQDEIEAWKGKATVEVKETIPGKQFAETRKEQSGNTFHEVDTKLSTSIVKCMVTDSATKKLDKLVDACLTVRDP